VSIKAITADFNYAAVMGSTHIPQSNDLFPKGISLQ